ncbi:GNAT family N-acetyltransferase [Methanolobus sp. ZRKC3]|uniref:GNAT family N-acetyltransferase n=1 Tax=Methanolobus sp. ZRKC3 TaxID=3125786 RepID=UPI003251DC4D
MDRTIRKYKQEDLNDVLASWESASRVAHSFLTDEFLEKERHDIPDVYLPNAETWVAEQDGQVIGFITLVSHEVGGIFVKAEFHGTGAGKALMDKARELHGYLEVEVFEKNITGRKFYSRYGFQYLAESIHKETGNKILRLKFTFNQ